MLKSLLEKVQQVCETEGNPVTAVFLVGDIAYGGKKEQYRQFRDDFLRPLQSIPSLAGAKVFAVLGNHDVDCDQCLPISWEGIQKRNQDVIFLEDAAGKSARKSRVSVFEAYQDLVKENDIISANPLEQISVLHESSALPVSILATNTALFHETFDQSSNQGPHAMSAQGDQISEI